MSHQVLFAQTLGGLGFLTALGFVTALAFVLICLFYLFFGWGKR